MRQRLLIAMAVALNPSVLIADEPTTALDVTVQAQIMALLRDLRAEYDMAVVLITHDLALVAEEADRVAVMYAGNIVETGPVAEVFANPQHPYTKGLLDSVPVQRRPRRGPQVHRRRTAGPALHPGGLRLPGALPAGPGNLRHNPAHTLAAGTAAQRPQAGMPLPGGGQAMSDRLLEVRDVTKVVPGRRCRQEHSCAHSTASTSSSPAARHSAWSASPAAASPRWQGHC